jgi:hypothetical protein
MALRQILMAIMLIVPVFVGAGKEPNKPMISWDQVNAEITLDRNAKGTAKYSFVNKLGKAVQIRNVSTSCGCTSAIFNKNPITNGADGSIFLSTNSAGKKWTYEVMAVVEFDDQPPQVLNLKVTIRKPGEPTRAPDQPKPE